MSDVKNKQVNIYIDQTAANVALEKLQAQADKLNKKIDDGRVAGKNMVAELSKLDEVNSKIKNVQDQIDKGLKPSISQQTTLVRQLNNELSRISQSDPAFVAKAKQFQDQNKILQELKTNASGVADLNEKVGGSFGKIIGRVTEYFAAYSVVNTVASNVKAFFEDSIKEAEKAEETYSKLQNILENLGRSDVFDHLKNQAEDLLKEYKTFKADEVIDVFQKLITYGKLTENQIDQLTPVIIDLASHQRVDLATATDLVIKSLQGNNKGLIEYGINIKNATTTTDRFGVLMDQLKPRVEGAAKAFGETTAGQIKETQVEIDELKESIGTKLEPAVKSVYQGVQGLIQGVEDFFTKLSYSFQQLIKDTVYVSKVLGDFVTFQFKAGQALQDQRAKEKQIAAERIQHAEDVANAQAFAESFAKDAATKSLIEQYKILAQQQIIQKISLANFQDLKTSGKATAKELQAAWNNVISDTKIVQQLKSSLASQTDTKVLGVGGSDDKKPDSKYNELLHAAEEFNKKIRDLQQQSTDASLTQNQKELADIKHKYDEIFIAYNDLQKKLKGSKISLGFSEDDIKN